MVSRPCGWAIALYIGVRAHIAYLAPERAIRAGMPMYFRANFQDA